MTRIFFKFNICAFCERVLKKGRVKAKIVRKLSLNFTFGQGSCLISDFARENSSKDVLVQIFLRLDTVIFNNNFVFCMMSSFCSMARIAGWILVREIIKRTNVRLKKYWKKLDKHLWQGLFCESCEITHHNKWIRHFSRTLRKVLTEVWKDKEAKENMKEFLIQIKANELCKLSK